MAAPGRFQSDINIMWNREAIEHRWFDANMYIFNIVTNSMRNQSPWRWKKNEKVKIVDSHAFHKHHHWLDAMFNASKGLRVSLEQGGICLAPTRPSAVYSTVLDAQEATNNYFNFFYELVDDIKYKMIKINISIRNFTVFNNHNWSTYIYIHI